MGKVDFSEGFICIQSKCVNRGVYSTTARMGRHA